MQDRGSWVIDKLPFTSRGRRETRVETGTERGRSVHVALTSARSSRDPLPVEILQSVNRITLLYENDHEVRRIFMDGRRHPTDLDATTMGHSIGRWESATLVIDTVGLREGWFRPEGVPYTGKAHVIERLTLDKGGDKIRVALHARGPRVLHKAGRSHARIQTHATTARSWRISASWRSISTTEAAPCNDTSAH